MYKQLDESVNNQVSIKEHSEEECKDKTPYICIYHNKDMDGMISGALFTKHCEMSYHNVQMIGADYGDDILNHPAIVENMKTKNHNIVIADLSFDMEVIIKLSYSCKDELVILDHHKTFYDKIVPSFRENELIKEISHDSVKYDVLNPDNSITKVTKYEEFLWKDNEEVLSVRYIYSNVYSACALVYFYYFNLYSYDLQQRVIDIPYIQLTHCNIRNFQTFYLKKNLSYDS